MRFGFVLPCYVMNLFRERLAQASFASLCRSVTAGLDASPVIIFVAKPEPKTLEVIRAYKFPGFVHDVIAEPADAASIDACFIYGLQRLVDTCPDVTHLGFLTNDWVYNKRWLFALQDLINRHPDASAWWVYRSAFEKFHKTLKLDDPSGDVLVRSTNAAGMFPRSGFDVYPDYHACRIDPPRIHEYHFDETTKAMDFSFGGLSFHCESGEVGTKSLLALQHGLTFDLYDPWLRPGDRWVTRRSYILNMGVHGVNQQPEHPEYAIDFIGEDCDV